MSTIVQEGFSLGRIISLSFRTFTSNIVPFGVLSAVALGLPQLIFLVAGISATKNPALAAMSGDWSMVGLAVLVFLAMFVAAFVLYGALVYGTFRSLSGNRASMGDLVSRGLGRALPVLAISILFFFGIMFGFLLLIVPGFMLMCMWAVAVPADVVEDVGILGAFTRSAELTSGYRWHIFGLGILYYLGSLALALVLGAFLLIFRWVPYLNLTVMFLVNVAATAFTAVSLTVLYAELRRIKEGVNVDEVARVFD